MWVRFPLWVQRKASSEAFFYEVYFQGVIQGPLEGSAKGVIQGSAKGVIQGSAKGVIQGSAKGVIQGSAKGPVEGRYAKRPCKAPSERP